MVLTEPELALLAQCGALFDQVNCQEGKNDLVTVCPSVLGSSGRVGVTTKYNCGAVALALHRQLPTLLQKRQILCLHASN
jgi:hypothetical protein